MKPRRFWPSHTAAANIAAALPPPGCACLFWSWETSGEVKQEGTRLEEDTEKEVTLGDLAD